MAEMWYVVCGELGNTQWGEIVDDWIRFEHTPPDHPARIPLNCELMSRHFDAVEMWLKMYAPVYSGGEQWDTRRCSGS